MKRRSPYDLSTRDNCRRCGLPKRSKKRPQDISPYDLSEAGGIRCSCNN